MAYNCDICSKEMSGKSNATFFKQNRVLTSPGYWEHVYQKGIFPLEEEMLGMFPAKIARKSTWLKAGSRKVISNVVIPVFLRRLFPR